MTLKRQMSTMVLARCGPTSTKSAALQCLAAWLLGLIVLVAMVLVLRRSAGGLTTPLSTPALAACGATLALASIAMRVLQPGTGHASEFWRTAWRAAPTAANVLIASSLSIRGTPSGGVFALWMLAALGELAGQLICQWSAARARSELGANRARTALGTSDGPALAIITPSASHDHEARADDDGISQRFIRRCDERGRELLSGWLRVDIAPGERTKFAHVAFCPPLLNSPQCEIDLADDQASAAVAQVLPQGARFELKLPRPATAPTSIALEWVAYEADEKSIATEFTESTEK